MTFASGHSSVRMELPRPEKGRGQVNDLLHRLQRSANRFQHGQGNRRDQTAGSADAGEEMSILCWLFPLSLLGFLRKKACQVWNCVEVRINGIERKLMASSRDCQSQIGKWKEMA